MIKINLIDAPTPQTLEPISSTRELADFPVAGIKFIDALKWRIEQAIAELKEFAFDRVLNIRSDFWPSIDILDKACHSKNSRIVCKLPNASTIPVAWFSDCIEDSPAFNNIDIDHDNKSKLILYPWDLLFVNEQIISLLKENDIRGTVRNNVTIDGVVEIGEETVLLPGVYIEGNAIIGKKCKIGPNCYIRGNTYIGDECHVGQAVEIKNSIIMNKVSIGHLSYVGDSIIGEGTNFGAGTTTANLRHDGKNHSSKVSGKIIDTGRRKLGIIVGDGVHTGINTTLYPGRKLWPSTSTLPGEIVKHDIK